MLQNEKRSRRYRGLHTMNQQSARTYLSIRRNSDGLADNTNDRIRLSTSSIRRGPLRAVIDR